MRYKLNHAGLLVPDNNGLIDAKLFPGFSPEQIARGLTVPVLSPITIDNTSPGYQREAERIERRNRRMRG